MKSDSYWTHSPLFSPSPTDSSNPSMNNLRFFKRDLLFTFLLVLVTLTWSYILYPTQSRVIQYVSGGVMMLIPLLWVSISRYTTLAKVGYTLTITLGVSYLSQVYGSDSHLQYIMGLTLFFPISYLKHKPRLAVGLLLMIVLCYAICHFHVLQKFFPEIIAPAYTIALQSWVGWIVMVIIGIKALLHFYIASSKEQTYANERAQANRQIQFLTSLVNYIPQAIFVKDKAGRFSFVNKQFTNYLGVEPEQLLGCKDSDFGLPAEELKKYQRNEQHILQTGEKIETCEVNSFKGSQNWYKTIKAPLIDENDDIIGIVGMTSNVTQNVLQAEALTQSEQKFRKIFEQCPIGLALVKSDRTFVANPTFYQFLGYSPQKIQDQCLEEFVQSKDRNNFRAHLASLTTAEGLQGTVQFEVRFVHQNGHDVAVNNYCSLLNHTDENPEQYQYLICMEDISARRQTEATLRSVYDSIEGAIWAVNKEKKIISYNKSAFESIKAQWGVEMEQNVSLRDHIKIPIIDEIRSYYDKAFENKAFNIYKCFDVGGKTEHYSLNFNPIKDENGEILGCTVASQNITRFKEIEAILREKELRYTMLFDSVYDAMILFDLETEEKIDCNQATVDLFGYASKEELLKTNLTKHIIFDAKETLNAADFSVEKLALMQKIYKHRYTIKMYRKDHQPFDAEVTLIREKELEQPLLIILIRDITEKLSAELQLIASESRYRMLFDNAFDGIAILDVHTQKPISWNAKLLKLFDFTTLDLIDGVCDDKLYQGNLFYESRNLDELLSDGQFQTRCEFHLQGGRQLFVEIHIFRLPEPNTHQIVYIYKDITAKYLAEQERSNNLTFLETLMDTIPSAIFYKDQHFIYRGCNRAFTEYVGLTKEDIIGRSTLNIHPNYQGAFHHQHDVELMQEGGKISYESFIEFEEEKHSFVIHKSTFKNNREEIAGIVGIAVDITDRKKIEEALAEKLKDNHEKNQQLKRYIESNMQLENFAYIASHDLREPLLTTKGFAIQLQKRYEDKLDIRGQMIVRQILSSTHNMDQLIQHLLIYSRVHSDKIYLEELSIPTIIKEVLGELNSLIEKSQAEIHIETLPDKIVGSEMMIRQLFQNLISNAIKFHKPHIRPIVWIGGEEQDKYWQFYVSDNGIGLAPAYHDKIFVLFQRLHDKRSYEGSGMGLAICKKIVEQHEGDIKVISELDQGAKFIFSIKKTLIKTPEPSHSN